MKLKVKNYLYRAILDSQNRKIKRKKKLLLSQNIVNNHKKLQYHNLGNKNPKKRNLNPNKIKLIGVEASGRDFDMDIDIASMSFSK